MCYSPSLERILRHLFSFVGMNPHQLFTFTGKHQHHTVSFKTVENACLASYDTTDLFNSDTLPLLISICWWLDIERTFLDATGQRWLC
ncbi:hypothetical protein TNIN_382261 [Trichonephila inaurata madagascariensis]|uniref:Uncharacterized protein n=1 Tax=Trichonephila inaurata madagascariensis TaxID=2747483 RepID=A0A8X6XSX6_9ARAC|nr:hypothetical protein TNIN_489801 [Trichonephila inaurata madagascariensis]GFY62829.1 hypothetical protein TNIN_382261 [Trichonephila inaurata madagascariensis]